MFEIGLDFCLFWVCCHCDECVRSAINAHIYIHTLQLLLPITAVTAVVTTVTETS